MQDNDVASEFPDPRSSDYYNTAGSGLCPVTVRDQVKQYVEASCADAIGASQKYAPYVEVLRDHLARLLGCTGAELALMHHTAEGANVIAHGLQWQEGDTIMTLDREYPSTIYPWMNVQRLHNVHLIPRSGVESWPPDCTGRPQSSPASVTGSSGSLSTFTTIARESTGSSTS